MTIPDFRRYPTTRHALAAALGFYACDGVRQLARLLGVGEGVPLLAILGIPDRSPWAIYDALYLDSSGIVSGAEGTSWMEGHCRRRRLAEDGTLYPPRPTVPAVPLVLAPQPDWLGWHTPPNGSVVTPDAEFVADLVALCSPHLALDTVDLHLAAPVFQMSSPPLGRLRYRAPKPLAIGEHLLSIWYVAEAAIHDLYTWSFEVAASQSEI